jgi:uncharacterized protein YdeI (YjbR/CyaY-like superfamily)
MEIGELLRLNSRAQWRSWLAEHHQDKKEIWLALHNSGSPRRELPLGEAVEEALCFGWIDSTLKPLDAESYALRFSPRRKTSYWAESNRQRALRLLREGLMTAAGIAVLPPEVLQEWEQESRPEES